MCKKAARQLAVLKRIGHLLTIKGKLAIFNSFIESNFNYCPLIWHFCSQTNTKKVEKIQERALRFIYNNYSSTHNHRRTGQHPFGGADRVLPEWIQWGGG